MGYIDLHVHSNASDGTCTPEELVDLAIEKKLSAFALTDHDTVDGLSSALAYAMTKNIEVIPGIELSTDYNGKDIHIVGLFIQHHNPQFRDKLKEFCDSREIRNKKMAQALTDAGFPVNYQELVEQNPCATVTRAHFARYMLEHGYIKTLKEAFEKYIGDDCPYYVPREKVTPEDGVRLILSAGGVPILAHPLLYHMNEEELTALIVPLKKVGLVGIEALYPGHSEMEESMVRRLARKNDLLISGGSDFHGGNKPGLELGTGYGGLKVPYELLSPLRRYAYNIMM